MVVRRTESKSSDDIGEFARFGLWLGSGTAGRLLRACASSSGRAAQIACQFGHLPVQPAEAPTDVSVQSPPESGHGLPAFPQQGHSRTTNFDEMTWRPDAPGGGQPLDLVAGAPRSYPLRRLGPVDATFVVRT